MLDHRAAHRATVAIIIVTFNSRHEIGACLDSIVGQMDPFPTTITVVDNASTDGTAAFVRERWPSVNVIRSQTNGGFAKANNIGVRATTSDYVIFLNPDTVTAPGSLQTLLRGLASRPDAAVAGARLLNNGFPELSWGYPINPWGELRQMLTAALYYGRVRSIVHKIAKLSVVSRDVAWVSGACMAVKREDLDAVGLFDERYFMYREDVDLCVAMRKRGREVLFIAPAEVQHARGKSGSKNPDLERLRGRSHLAYYRKHLPAWAPLLKVYLKLRGRL